MTDSMLTEDRVRRALKALGDLLELRHEHHEVAVIGGTCMLLSRHSSRVTRDVDVVAAVDGSNIVAISQLPDSLGAAARDVALRLRLPADWLNAGPAGMTHGELPEGFLGRCQIERFSGLTVHLAGRLDMIAFKLFAAADQWGDPLDKHRSDLALLSSTPDELQWAADWARQQDPSSGFAQLLGELLAALAGGSAH
ncbi:MAG TPA: DUF6036 family nucleotidyltransferase [Burkholderiaceae bacterium]